MGGSFEGPVIYYVRGSDIGGSRRGHSHIFMDTYARVIWMGFETKIYIYGWVIF